MQIEQSWNVVLGTLLRPGMLSLKWIRRIIITLCCESDCTPFWLKWVLGNCSPWLCTEEASQELLLSGNPLTSRETKWSLGTTIVKRCSNSFPCHQHTFSFLPQTILLSHLKYPSHVQALWISPSQSVSSSSPHQVHVSLQIRESLFQFLSLLCTPYSGSYVSPSPSHTLSPQMGCGPYQLVIKTKKGRGKQVSRFAIGCNYKVHFACLQMFLIIRSMCCPSQKSLRVAYNKKQNHSFSGSNQTLLKTCCLNLPFV